MNLKLNPLLTPLRGILPLLLLLALSPAGRLTAVAAPAYPESVLAAHPAAYWRLNETLIQVGPPMAADATGHGHTFTYHLSLDRSGTGADVGPQSPDFPGISASNPAPTLPGSPLTQTNGYLGIATGVLPGTNDYTFETWFKPTAVGGIGAYIYHHQDVGATNGGDYLGIWPAGGGNVLLFIYDGGSVLSFGVSSLALNQWHHVAVTRQGDDVTVYLDGQVEIPTFFMPPAEGTRWTNGVWGLGGRVDQAYGQQRFVGNLDEISIYRGGLSASVIQADYASATSASGNYPQQVLSNQPEVYWRLDEVLTPVGPDIAADASGNSHNFTYHRAMSRTGTGTDVGPLPPGIPGFETTNNAPTLPGNVLSATNGYLGIPTGVLPGQNDYTIEMWFRRSQPVGGMGEYLVHRSDVGLTNTSGDYLGVWGQLFIYNGADINGVGPNVIQLGQWYHVAMTRQGDNVTVYLNGQVEIPTTVMTNNTGTTWTHGDWGLGGRVDFSLQQRWAGNIDEVAIYSNALSAPEILRQYNSSVPPTYQTTVVADGPVAYWALNETTALSQGTNTAADATGHGHTFTYHLSLDRSGTGADVGPQSPDFPGISATNPAPTLPGTPLTRTNGYLGIATGVLPGTNDYTFETWFKPTAVGGIGAYLYHHQDVGAQNGGDYVGLWPAGGGNVNLFIYDGGSDLNGVGVTSLALNQWHHVAVTRQGDDVTLYLDGQVEIPTFSMPPANDTQWTNGVWGLGGRVDQAYGQQRFVGNLDEISIYRGALSVSAIQADYASATNASGNYPQQVLSNQPEVYWRLNELAPVAQGGSIAMDGSGNGNSFAYCLSASRTGTGNDVGPRPPQFVDFSATNNAPTLPGVPLSRTNGYLGLPTGLLPGQNDYTFETWFKPTAVGGIGAYLYHHQDVGAQTGGDYVGLWPAGGGNVNLFIFDGGCCLNGVGVTSLALNRWHHVAVTRHGNDVTVYLDGQVEIPTFSMPPAAGTQWTQGDWGLGGRVDSAYGQQRFVGKFDEIAIFGRALTQSAIQAHYSVTVVPALSIQASGNDVILSWPAAAAGFTLNSTLSLGPSAPGWVPVSAAPVTVGSTQQVTVTNAAGSRFFRLIK